MTKNSKENNPILIRSNDISRGTKIVQSYYRSTSQEENFTKKAGEKRKGRTPVGKSKSNVEWQSEGPKCESDWGKRGMRKINNLRLNLKKKISYLLVKRVFFH